MSQIVIDTDAIKKGILYFFAVVGALAIVSVIVVGAVDHYRLQGGQMTNAPASVPAPTPTVTVPAQQYPYVVEFTVLSTTVAKGHYAAIATSGQIFNLPDFSAWNSLWPRNTYTATITGKEADGTLDVGTVNRLSSPVSLVTGAALASPSAYVIEFTVLSAPRVNGNYEVLTTDGRILYINDFATWNSMYEGNTYRGTVIGEEMNGAYDIGAVTLISTAFYNQRRFYLRDDYAPVYRSPSYFAPVYRYPVYYPPNNNPPVYHPPLNRATPWVGS